MKDQFKHWCILHVDLTQRIGSIDQSKEDGILIYFWVGSILLGHRRVYRSQLPLSAAEIAQLASGESQSTVQQLQPTLTGIPRSETTTADWREEIIREMDTADSTPRVVDRVRRTSLVIPTRNRSNSLRRCLKSVTKLDPSPMEIIVVDNAPGDDQTQRVLEEFPEMRYVKEPTPGLATARNCGVTEARGEFIAFVDDDVEVPSWWLARAIAGFFDDDTDAVLGMVVPKSLDTEAEVHFELLIGYLRKGHRARHFNSVTTGDIDHNGAASWDVGAGANMVVRRSAFEQFGLFDPTIGPGTSGCGEDSEFYYRLLHHGRSCRYLPWVVVYHHHRATMPELKHQLFNYTKGTVSTMLLHFRRYRHSHNLYFAFIGMPKYLIKETYMSLRQRRFARFKTLPSQFLGYPAGLIHYMTHPSSDIPRLAPPKSRQQ